MKLNGKKMIVFAPHPGDETWGCGGIIAKRVSEGYDLIIIVMTDGRYAFSKVLNIHSDPTPSELKEIRKCEVKRTTKILGVPEENLLFLDFEDGMLEENEKEAEEKVTAILRENPPPVEVYYTYENDCHIDHRVTNRIVRNSIEKLNLHVIKYQYSILKKYGRIGKLIYGVLNIFKRNMVRVDVSQFLALKKAAIKEIKSEVSIISGKQTKPLVEDFSEFLKDKTLFYINK
jgi:LmbE family N-acetylglucosaminyl deacetylase